MKLEIYEVLTFADNRRGKETRKTVQLIESSLHLII